MDVFDLRQRLVDDYADYTRSFVDIRDERIRERVEQRARSRASSGPTRSSSSTRPSSPAGRSTSSSTTGSCTSAAAQIFRREQDAPTSPTASRCASTATRARRSRPHARGGNYVLTTGTGSGKSLAYIVPIVDHVLRNGTGHGHPGDRRLPDERAGEQPARRAREVPRRSATRHDGPVTFGRYTGQESEEEREEILAQPARHPAHELRDARATSSRGRSSSAVVDGRAGAAVPRPRRAAHLPRPAGRRRRAARPPRARGLQRRRTSSCVGTSATLAGPGTLDEQRAEVARVASLALRRRRSSPRTSSARRCGGRPRRRRPTTPAFVERSARARRRRARRPSYDAFVADPLASLDRDARSASTRSRRRAASSARRRGRSTATTAPPRCSPTLTGRRPRALRRRRSARTLMQGYAHPAPGHRLPGLRLPPAPVLQPRRDRLRVARARGRRATSRPQEQQFVPGDRDTRAAPARLLPRVRAGVLLGAHRRPTSDGLDGRRAARPQRHDRRRRERRRLPLHQLRRALARRRRGRSSSRLPEDWLEPRGDGVRVKRELRQHLPQRDHARPDGRRRRRRAALSTASRRRSASASTAASPTAAARPRDFGKLADARRRRAPAPTTILGLVGDPHAARRRRRSTPRRRASS